ncbi:MAG: hypothetical protein ACM3UN_00985 [Bacillota bacterium]
MKRAKLAVTFIVTVIVIVSTYIAATSFHTNTPDAAQLPSPTATSTALSGNSVGISLHSLNSSDAQLVIDSNARWIRIDVDSNFNSAVAIAHSKGLKVLGILDSWMFDKATTFSLSDWQTNVSYYVSNNPSVEAWEIWNEPANPNVNNTLLNVQLPSQANMSKIVQFYYEMVTTASPIIRQCNSSATIVLMGGLNLYSGGDPNLQLDMDFASQLSNTNISQYGDAISVHAYNWVNDSNPSSAWDSYNTSLSFYKDLFPNLSIWVTETGQVYNAQDNGEVQAQYLTSALSFFNEKVAKVFWYSFHDNSDEVPSQRFGLVDDVGTHRSAYTNMRMYLMQ